MLKIIEQDCIVLKTMALDSKIIEAGYLHRTQRSPILQLKCAGEQGTTKDSSIPSRYTSDWHLPWPIFFFRHWPRKSNQNNSKKYTIAWQHSSIAHQISSISLAPPSLAASLCLRLLSQKWSREIQANPRTQRPEGDTFPGSTRIQTTRRPGFFQWGMFYLKDRV